MSATVNANDLDEAREQRPEPDHGFGRTGSPAATVTRFLERFGLLALTALAIAVFAVLPASSGLFLSSANIQHVLSDQTVVTVAAFAVIVPLVAGHFDVSCGSVIGVSCLATAASMSRYGLPLPAAICVGIGIGALIGLVIGVLVAYFKLNAIIVTLAATIVISGMVEWYTKGVSINTDISTTLTDFGSETWWGIPQPAVLLIMVSLVVAYLLGYTPFGRHLHMIGENERAAHLVGVNVSRVSFWAFVIGGALSGIAGVVLCARIGGANPQDGPSYLFPALVAVYLGTTAFRPGQFSVGGTLLAVFFVAVTVSGLSLSGAEPWVQPVFNGTALLVAVGLSRLLTLRRKNGAP